MKKLIKSHYKQNKQIIDNLVWRALQLFGKQGVTFLIFILCAKSLTPHDFGLYNYILTVIFLLIMFCDFGISTATSKYVAEYSAISKEKLQYVLFSSGTVILILTILIVIFTTVLGQLYLDNKYMYVLYLLPLVFLVPMTSLLDGIYRGLERFKTLAIISLFTGTGSLPFIFLLVYNYGLIGALISQILFYFALLITLFWGYREYKHSVNFQVIKDIGMYSFLIGLSSVGYFFYSQISTIVMGHYGYIIQISYYELLNKFFAFIILPASILGQVIAPRSSKLFALKDTLSLKHLFNKYLAVSIIFGVIVSIILYFCMPLLIHIFFKQYDPIILKEFLNIQIFIFFILVSTATINNGIITPTNYSKNIMISSILFGILNFPMSIILCYYLSYKGIVLSSLITYILNTIIIYIIYYRTTFKITK